MKNEIEMKIARLIKTRKSNWKIIFEDREASPRRFSGARKHRSWVGNEEDKSNNQNSLPRTRDRGVKIHVLAPS